MLQDIKEKNHNEKGGTAGKVLLVIMIIASIALVGFLITRKLNIKEEVIVASIPSVNVITPSKGRIEKISSVTGTIMPSDTFYVVNKVAGEITNIYVENGQKVKRGDKICDIDNSKSIESARIQYDAAKNAYDRMTKLYESGDISKQNYEQVKAQYEGAKLAYDTQVEFSTPVATGDGVIENTNMTLNVTIGASTVLCYITSDEAKEVQFGVTERVLDGINLYDTVKIEKQGKTYAGRINSKAKLLDAKTGLFNVKAIIEDENNFASGVNAKVSFVFEKSENNFILHNDVIYQDGQTKYVYSVDDENKIIKIPIVVGISNDNKTEVLSGIDENTKIISTWTQDLTQGTEVNVLQITKDIIENENFDDFVYQKADVKKIEIVEETEASDIFEDVSE